MTELIWGRQFCRRPDFPDRLDDEASFLSLCRSIQLSAITAVADNSPVRLRLVYRRDLYLPLFSTSRLTLDARIEIFDLPEGISDTKALRLRPWFVDFVQKLTRDLGLAVAPPTLACADFSLAPDPGDLPGHLMLDAALRGACIHTLESASNHRLVSISGRSDVEIFRLPLEGK